MKKAFHIAGHAASFIALFAMLGGHWLVLQSVAWTRMLAENSAQDPLAVAVAKTFDGQHPCPMCLEIREGRQKEQQQNGAWAKEDKIKEFFWEPRALVIPLRLDVAIPSAWERCSIYHAHLEPPPKPPPRWRAAA